MGERCSARALAAAGLFLALLVCPACSNNTCAGPARFPPSVFIHADTLFQDHAGAHIKVCATECTTLTTKNTGGETGQQLVVSGANERALIDLAATVTIPKQRPVVSSLGVQLTKTATTGVCGTNISYATDVHLDSTGKLQEGRS